eukprot:TRINITY_DN18600_c0_g1_i1.p1 TRINITY_DN18600_c0_g1~~TRINITY_DN18600_c0_g1_i1.p1  ORF type:complete len:280 (+),score=58.06 TRINITY_DN18600_c0_g1_i1:66-842(+)
MSADLSVLVPGTIPGRGLGFVSPARDIPASAAAAAAALGKEHARRDAAHAAAPEVLPPGGSPRRSASPIGAAFSPMPQALAGASIAPWDRAASPYAAAAAGVAEGAVALGGGGLSGAAVYAVRQRLEPVKDPAAAAPVSAATVLQAGGTPEPPVALLGVYGTSEMAQFYMDRAVADAARRLRSAREEAEDGVSSKPEGVPDEVWQQVRSATQSSELPRREPCAQAELGYVWRYRRWNVIVKVWVERRVVDAPPTQSLW